ncbi:hypothetical protein Tco_0173669 [Tanacetum coccineum]
MKTLGNVGLEKANFQIAIREQNLEPTCGWNRPCASMAGVGYLVMAISERSAIGYKLDMSTLCVPSPKQTGKDERTIQTLEAMLLGREVKRLKRSRIPLVKVRWNSKRGPEFTWEREDQFKKKYPHLFAKTTPSSSAAL